MSPIRRPSIRSRLAQLVNDSIGTARGLASALDGDLSSVVSAPRALATSAYLAKGNFAAFQDPAP